MKIKYFNPNYFLLIILSLFVCSAYSQIKGNDSIDTYTQKEIYSGLSLYYYGWSTQWCDPYPGVLCGTDIRVELRSVDGLRFCDEMPDEDFDSLLVPDICSTFTDTAYEIWIKVDFAYTYEDWKGRYFKTEDSLYGWVIPDSATVISPYDRKIWLTWCLQLDGSKNFNPTSKTLITVKNSASKNLFAYPNPFSGTTRLNYNVPTPGKVDFGIYNSLGQVVKEFSGKSAAGQQSIYWDGRDNKGQKLKSGVYIVRLETRTTFSTNKVILTK